MNTDGNASGERLIIFTRYPEPGKTKTRMIPILGAAGAAELQRRMTEHLVARLRGTVKTRSLPVEIRFDGGDENRMCQWLGAQFSFQPQGPGDIGRRMHRAFDDGFKNGCEAVVIVGSDIPQITGTIIQRAFDELESRDLVLGPAADGGYYLIGLQHAAFNRGVCPLFTGIDWGTDKVLEQTVAATEKQGLSFVLLKTLADVDRPEDLGLWQQTLHLPGGLRISVILPTLNEADNIRATLTGLQGQHDVEMIVVDGGSRDDTVAIAKSLGARVIITAPSRAGQMNAGAAAATGNVLLFLHADTRLPDDFARHIRAAACQKEFCAGAFSLRIESAARGLRLIEKTANLRARYLQLPYGDQALFTRREIFNDIGGFPDLPIMEDFELVRRLKQQGKIVLLPSAVQTSPRRWLKIGIFRTWLINQAIVAAYLLGISPQRLGRWYSRGKGASKR